MNRREYSRLLKVRALAERGIAGEQAAALNLLKRLHPSYRCMHSPCTACLIRPCHDRLYQPRLADHLAAERELGTVAKIAKATVRYIEPHLSTV